MAIKNYSCQEVALTHARMVELRASGHLQLGILDELAVKIANTKGLGPTKTTANLAFYFWGWIALGGFIFTVYLSFTSDWWWFIVGLFGMALIWNANKKGHSQNYLEAAMVDSEFYERVRQLNGWIYQIEEKVVEDQNLGVAGH